MFQNTPVVTSYTLPWLWPFLLPPFPLVCPEDKPEGPWSLLPSEEEASGSCRSTSGMSWGQDVWQPGQVQVPLGEERKEEREVEGQGDYK